MKQVYESNKKSKKLNNQNKKNNIVQGTAVAQSPSINIDTQTKSIDSYTQEELNSLPNKYSVEDGREYLKSFDILNKTFPKKVSRVNTVIKLLQAGVQLPKALHVHPLKGKYKGFMDCHIFPDYVLRYYVNEEEKIIRLVDMGTHVKTMLESLNRTKMT